LDAVEIMPKDTADPVWVRDFLQRHHSERVASRGRLLYPADLPGFVALLDGAPIALATCRVEGDECEMVTLHSDLEGRGAGSRLVECVTRVARDARCRRLWLVTTNDNTRAFRFYQRRGFTITAVHLRAVDDARRALKPEIPLLGNDDIPIRDEIELELVF
jgi:ribosomal protein S18 acetylase RimI-like enzyme